MWNGRYKLAHDTRKKEQTPTIDSDDIACQAPTLGTMKIGRFPPKSPKLTAKMN